MKTLMSKLLGLVLSSAILLPSAFASDSAVADDHSSAVSFNVGYMSEYWYRGAYQAESSMSETLHVQVPVLKLIYTQV